MGQATPINIAGHGYDADTVDLLRGVLDEVWDQLTESQRNRHPRSVIAERLLRAAASGERDADVLRTYALDELNSATDVPRPGARRI
jgi:hypothetical protein